MIRGWKVEDCGLSVKVSPVPNSYFCLSFLRFVGEKVEEERLISEHSDEYSTFMGSRSAELGVEGCISVSEETGKRGWAEEEVLEGKD